jgi:tetratricopeptide (TPR) repeat protein
MPARKRTHIVPKGWSWALLIGLGLIGSLRAQVFTDAAFRAMAQEGLQQLYDARFATAEATFSQLGEAYPTHPGPAFLLATNRWWQSMMCNTHHFDAYIDSQLQRCLTLNEEYLRGSPYLEEYALFQYLGHALHARLASHRREWFTAANRGRKLLPYLDECLAYAEHNVEFCFAAGIYHYYAATYATSHSVVKPFMAFFPEGDVSQGIAELERAVAEPNFTRPEAMYYLSYIYLEPYARDTVRAQQISRQLYQRYPHNPWFACEYARVHVHTGFHDQARPVLAQLIQRYEAQAGAKVRFVSVLHSIYTTKLAMRAHHYRGLCFLDGAQDYLAAAEDFETSLRYAERCGLEADHYVAASRFYLGRCYQALGHKAQARTAYQRCYEMEGNEGFEERAEAALERLKRL